MNNSFIATENILDEPIIDTSAILRQRQTELLEIIKAIETISKSSEWQSLKRLIFDNKLEGLEKQLKIESTKNELNAPEIYRLNGQLIWAKRYSDFYKLAEVYKTELNNITKKLNENATIN